MREDQEQITCATYTHARRHPMVLGQIGGWRPPFQLSVPQVAVLLVAYAVELWTWDHWSGILPGAPTLLLAVGGPALLAWAIRRARLEGRSLVRTGLGWMSLLAAAPGPGRVNGRVARQRRATALGRNCVYVAAGRDVR